MCGATAFAHFGHEDAYETIAARACKYTQQMLNNHIVDEGKGDKCICTWAYSLVTGGGVARVAKCWAHDKDGSVPRGATAATGGWSRRNLSNDPPAGRPQLLLAQRHRHVGLNVP